MMKILLKDSIASFRNGNQITLERGTKLEDCGKYLSIASPGMFFGMQVHACDDFELVDTADSTDSEVKTKRKKSVSFDDYIGDKGIVTAIKMIREGNLTGRGAKTPSGKQVLVFGEVDLWKDATKRAWLTKLNKRLPLPTASVDVVELSYKNKRGSYLVLSVGDFGGI